MKKKVFLFVIHAVFVLWGISQITDAKDEEPGQAEICQVGGREIVFDVKSGSAYCCQKDAGPQDIGNTQKCYRIEGQGPPLPDSAIMQPERQRGREAVRPKGQAKDKTTPRGYKPSEVAPVGTIKAPQGVPEGAKIQGNRVIIKKGYTVKRRSDSEALLMRQKIITGKFTCACSGGTGNCSLTTSGGTAFCTGTCSGSCRFTITIDPKYRLKR